MNRKEMFSKGRAWFLSPDQKVVRSIAPWGLICLMLTIGLVGLVSWACAQEPEPAPLRFVVVPAENETTMFRQFLPVTRALEKQLQRPIDLQIGHDVQAAVDALRYGEWDLAYIDPAQYCELAHAYQVQPVAKIRRNGQATYRSVLVVKKHSKWKNLADIVGARLALGQPGSSATHLIPLALLHQGDMSLSDFCKVSTLSNEDEVALSVLVGDHDVGAMSMDVFHKYAPAGLRVLKASEAIPQFVLCASQSLSPSTIERIRKTLLSMASSEDEPVSFAPVTDREYNILRIMIKNITGKDYLSYPPQAVTIGLLPLYSAIILHKRFTPLAAYLSEETGQDFRLVIPKDFEQFVSIVRSGGVDFAYQNPYVYLLLAEGGYLRSLALTRSMEPDRPRSVFRGVIIARTDGPIQEIQDIAGQEVMVVSRKSAGGYWFQKLFLDQKGLDLEKMARVKEGKRHEDVILAVYRGEVQAGFVRESALSVVQDLVDMDQIRIVAATPYYPNWPFAVHQDTTGPLAAQVQQALIELTNEQVLRSMDIEGFVASQGDPLSDLKRKVNLQ